MGRLISRELIDAYHATTYRVQLSGRTVTFRATEPTPELNKFASLHSATSWIFITGYNPYSQLLSSDENEKRQELLKALLSISGYRFYAGEGIGDSGEWPAEPSLLVLNVDQEKALAFGRVFEQNALIYCEDGGVPEILFC